MNAVQIKEYGDENVMHFVDVPKPEPNADEILVKIHASAINPVDVKIRNGKGKTFGLQLPLILGADFAGTIEKAGSEITGFKEKDEVYGKILIGCYAEYVLVKESELALKPTNLDFEHAASIPMGALTAWQAIFDTAKLKSGQKILVHGASGGVGSMAVQLAKAKGAYVIGTASGSNKDFVTSLGVDEFIDYTSTHFEETVKDMDVVFDPIGGETNEKSYQVLKKGGFLVSLVQKGSDELMKKYGVTAEVMASEPNPKQLKEITELIEAGKVKTRVEKVFPLSDAQQAQKVSEEGHVQGKIILIP